MALTQQGLQYNLEKELEDTVHELHLTVTSLEKQMFIIGEVIIKMRDAGLSYERISDILKRSPRFANYSDNSLRTLASKWGRGVEALKADFGRNFEEVKRNIENQHGYHLTTGMIREYSGDIEAATKTNKSAFSMGKAFKKMDSDEKVEMITGLIEDFQQQHLTEEAVEQDPIQARTDFDNIKDASERWVEIATEYIKEDRCPVVVWPDYRAFIERMPCTHCGSNEGGSVHLDIKQVPVKLDGRRRETEIFRIPMCGECAKKLASGRLFYTVEDRMVLSLKNISVYLEHYLVKRKATSA